MIAATAVTLVDALDGHVEIVTDFPRPVKGEGERATGASLTLEMTDGVPHVTPGEGETEAVVNGAPLRFSAPLPAGEVVTVQLGDRLWYLREGGETTWLTDFDASRWRVFDIRGGAPLGECGAREILDLVSRLGANPRDCAACPAGVDVGFSCAVAAPAFRAISPDDAQVAALAGGAGKHFCPACWLRFDSGDALSIASHEELTGDPVLGPDHRLRFHPTRFNDAGQALDPMGLPAPDLACPHCRRQLPHGYIDTPHHILSVVGAPGSGKSYLLAVLTKTVADGLFRDFGMSFRDDDPSGNLMLNQMRNRLFSATTPEEAILAKTALEGAFYERLRRHGRTVALPRPFVYSIRTPGKPDTSLIFYDNAGEHFEPGLDPESSPGAQHVAKSAGIIFLFDPTSSAAFREKLEGRAHDPQLSQSGRIDQQDTILAEMDIRIKRLLGLGRSERISTPVAVLIGKSDVWAPLFDARALPSPIVGRKLALDVIDKNSDALRAMLLDLCPGLVGGAESVSDTVRYFGVTALGHSPQPIAEGPKAGMLAPDPRQLKPAGIEHAAYWLVSQAVPGVIPVIGA